MNPETNSKKWCVLITQTFHTSCYDGVGFGREQNSVGAHCKSSLLFTSFLLRDELSELSHIFWTSWPWFIFMALGYIYTKKREKLGKDPIGWINVKNQFCTRFSSPSVDYFYFPWIDQMTTWSFYFTFPVYINLSVSWSILYYTTCTHTSPEFQGPKRCLRKK